MIRKRLHTNSAIDKDRKKFKTLHSNNEKICIDLTTNKSNYNHAINSYNSTEFVYQYGNDIIIKTDGCHFKFVDVLADGNCFYHSILRSPILSTKFRNVLEFRHYLQESVLYKYQYDSNIEMIFHTYGVDINIWKSTITVMNNWATQIDMVLCSYILETNIVTVGNFLNGIIHNRMFDALNSIFGTTMYNSVHGNKIYIYIHNAGIPQARIINGNHFAYLDPISNNIMHNVTVQNSDTPKLTKPVQYSKEIVL